ncbi:MAG: MBL fold metallo-hydrolase, partial [Candidatus Heimdallarchaeota archaeon]|nr:MBL fold metallo-hydrolase [Candidatus Heimdallarchaeota archaeon]
VKDDKEFIVIDPGVSTYQLKKFKKLEKAGYLTLDKISRIFLTHHHWDHSLLASYFQQRFGSKIYCHLLEKEGVENGDVIYNLYWESFEILESDIKPFPDWAIKLVLWFMWRNYKPMKVNDTFMEGDELSANEIIQVIELPGHTPGMVGFYFPESKVFYVGDLFDSEFGLAMNINNPFSNFDCALSSLNRILDFDVNILIPGHGGSIYGREHCLMYANKKIEEAIEIREKLLGLLKQKKWKLMNLVKAIIPKPYSITKIYLSRHFIYVLLVDIWKNEGLKIEKRGRRNLVYR